MTNSRKRKSGQPLTEDNNEGEFTEYGKSGRVSQYNSPAGDTQSSVARGCTSPWQPLPLQGEKLHGTEFLYLKNRRA